jgi:broad specificity phosphatase PhoE
MKYDPTFKGKYSKYEGYRLSGLQRVSPDIMKSYKVKFKRTFNNPIFCSTLKRGIEIASIIAKHQKLKINKSKKLNEIKFDLKKLLSKREYEKYGSNLVRERFIQTFIDDRLIEKRGDIKKRIEKLIAVIKKLPAGNYLLISHSFYMKILQVYLEDQSLFEKPEVLKKYFDPNKKTFDFGKGFEFNVE